MHTAYDPALREGFPSSDSEANLACYAPEGYLASLTRLRDEAIAAGDFTRVARLEDRIIDHAVFLAEVARWGQRGTIRSRG